MKKIIFLLIFLLLSSIGFACVEPIDGMEISSDTIFCKGDYLVNEGFKIDTDNIILDCSRSTFTGVYSGMGVKILESSAVKIINCSFTDFEVGVYISGGSDNYVNNVDVSSNEIGVRLYSSTKNKVGGCLGDVDETLGRNNIVKDTTSCHADFVEAKVKSKIISHINKNVIIPATSEDFLNLIKENDDSISEFKYSDVNISKTMSFDGEKTIVKTTVSFIANESDIYVYEFVPKCFASDISDITFLGPKPKVIIEDPMFVWHVTPAQMPFEFSYLVNGEVYEGITTIALEDDKYEIDMSSENCNSYPSTIIVDKPKFNYMLIYLPIIFLPLFVMLYLFLSNRVRRD